MASSLFSYETLVHALAGATGSVVGMTAFYPLDTIRTRIQVEDSKKLQGSSWELLLRLANEEVQVQGPTRANQAPPKTLTPFWERPRHSKGLLRSWMLQVMV
ncbi:peroxisomal membrane protein PMP34-like isoform X2 [Hyposmocoma kahamanoa]|uniref:peroxisomal membrane protein PMP34-like isoform X2 n=1 Tax=Hyposmocoma kahamanoa TaxID=1477025 RepID=UPI000E6DA1C4|nr:peroxisomal membrane protein PMP34-like isoform X2 [Hyposmocoma kahamanoa]